MSHDETKCVNCTGEVRVTSDAPMRVALCGDVGEVIGPSDHDPDAVHVRWAGGTVTTHKRASLSKAGGDPFSSASPNERNLGSADATNDAIALERIGRALLGLPNEPLGGRSAEAPKCGVYLGDNDGTCPQLTCIRDKGHEGDHDNTRGDHEPTGAESLGHAPPISPTALRRAANDLIDAISTPAGRDFDHAWEHACLIFGRFGAKPTLLEQEQRRESDPNPYSLLQTQAFIRERDEARTLLERWRARGFPMGGSDLWDETIAFLEGSPSSRDPGEQSAKEKG